MRIIAGSFRGKRLASFRADIRPTTDRARETLFNIVRHRVPGSAWLDLYSGSGAVGIEAISQGARYVIFNDRKRESTILVRKNLARCHVEEGYEIHQKDAFTLLRNLRPPPIDFIFLDPPYKFNRHAKLLEKLSDMPWIQPETTIILEVFKKTPRPETTSRVSLMRTVRIGDNKLLFFSVPGGRAAGDGPVTRNAG
jgi:16S rRNA (guanine966-N2)-methyltransferase